MSPTLHKEPDHQKHEHPHQPVPLAVIPSSAAAKSMRSAMDLCADALIQAMVNARKF